MTNSKINSITESNDTHTHPQIGHLNSDNQMLQNAPPLLPAIRGQDYLLIHRYLSHRLFDLT